MGIGKFLLYLTAFGVLSYGSSVIINTISTFTERVRIPPFIFSFFIVGFLTSTAEIAVAINAVHVGKPEIFIGSILGGTISIFLIVIPLMTIMNRGIHIRRHMTRRTLAATLFVIGLPSIFAVDRTITNPEAIVLVLSYISLPLLLRDSRDTLNKVTFSKVESLINDERGRRLRDSTLLRLFIGGTLIFLASRFIVEQTLVYSEHFNVSPFIVSLLVIAVGTTLPEIVLAIQSAASDKAKVEDIAIGDFLGSAAANVFIFGLFTLINNGDVVSTQKLGPTLIFVAIALLSFYLFSRGKGILTTREGFYMLSMYVAFVIVLIISASL